MQVILQIRHDLYLDEFLFVFSSWLVCYLYPQKIPEMTQKALRHTCTPHSKSRDIRIPKTQPFGKHPLTTAEQSQNKFQVPPNILVVISVER